MVIKDEKMTLVHVSEINTVIFETPAVSVTGVLLSELAKNKVCILFCDEKHLPQGQYVPFSSHYMSSSHILEQAEWGEELKALVWEKIVRQKIERQSDVLLHYGKKDECKMLRFYIDEIVNGDCTNREGFAAKVYFNALFDSVFSRKDSDNAYNACLDYGYAILLGIVSREVVKSGYSLAIGIHHHNIFNSNNLACDVMEPFRPIVDCIVYTNFNGYLDAEMKKRLWNLANTEVVINGKNSFLVNAVADFFRDVCIHMDHCEGKLLEYEFKW
jgi:CRISPR-associated endonuclease Cas1 subtype II